MSEPVEPQVEPAVEPEVDPAVEPELVDWVDLDADADTDADIIEAEVVDGLPVLVEARELASGRWSASPTVQAAAAAATGFVAGAATLALMRRYGVRRVARDLHGLRDSLDSAGGRWRAPAGFGQGQTYIVHIRTVMTRPGPPE